MNNEKFFAVLLVGLFGWSNACLASGAASASDPTDIEYLIFWGPWPGDAPDPLDRIGPLAAKIGTTGDEKTGQLGFGPGIPFWVRVEPQGEAIRRALDTGPNKSRGLTETLRPDRSDLVRPHPGKLMIHRPRSKRF